jgi:hypothetical protein
LVLVECDDPGAQLECADADACVLSRGAAHADAVPTMMKCIIASSVKRPIERRGVMRRKIAASA